MEIVLIDTFVVPETSQAEFLEGANRVQGFVKALPGFVEGFVYEQTEGENPCNFLTTAVWANEDAFENAKTAVASRNQSLGFNPQETRARLGIESVRAVYSRSPY